MSEIVITSVLDEALKQVSERVAKKLTEGKRLTDTEVIVLLLDMINKRIASMEEGLNKRIDDLDSKLSQRIDATNQCIDDLRDELIELRKDVRVLQQEISSIKSDVIELMKRKLFPEQESTEGSS